MLIEESNIRELFQDLIDTDDDIRPRIKELVATKHSYQELEPLFENQAALLQENLISARFYKALADVALFAGKKEKSTQFIRKSLACVREEISVSIDKFQGSSSFPSTPAHKQVTVNLPVRLDLAGGWTDTPPYSLEKGGKVLNSYFTEPTTPYFCSN